jgi:hypothetical protein
MNEQWVKVIVPLNPWLSLVDGTLDRAVWLLFFAYRWILVAFWPVSLPKLETNGTPLAPVTGHTSSFISLLRASFCFSSAFRRFSISFSLSTDKIGRRLTSTDFFSLDTLPERYRLDLDVSTILWYKPVNGASCRGRTFDDRWTFGSSHWILRRHSRRRRAWSWRH